MFVRSTPLGHVDAQPALSRARTTTRRAGSLCVFIMSSPVPRHDRADGRVIQGSQQLEPIVRGPCCDLFRWSLAQRELSISWVRWLEKPLCIRACTVFEGFPQQNQVFAELSMRAVCRGSSLSPS